MDKGAKLIILKDRKTAKAFNETHILSQNLKRALLERRAELLEDEYNEILMELEKE